jgi:CRISPR-associated endoribonuclease Cas6
MRFTCRIYFKEPSKLIIPTDYRNHFVSLIKESLKSSSENGENFINYFYEGNKSKPFTFSVYMPVKKDGYNFKFLEGKNSINFFFTTNDYEFLMRVYNGLNNKKVVSNMKLFKQEINKISDFYLYPNKKITKNEVVFKTLSPILIRDIDDGDYYVVPENLLSEKKLKYYKEKTMDQFIFNLKKNAIYLVKKFLDREINENDLEFNFPNIELVPTIHSSKVSKFKITYPGIKCIMNVKGDNDILKLFYDIGIGARRSEGFGMLDIIS